MRKISKEVRKKMSESALKRDNTNRIKALPKKEKHWRWNKQPSILTLHRRIHRKHGSAKQHKCPCGKEAIDWAFIGKGGYTDNVKDYKPLCRSCHMQMDGHAKKVDRTNHKIIRDKKGRIVKTIITKTTHGNSLQNKSGT